MLILYFLILEGVVRRHPSEIGFQVYLANYFAAKRITPCWARFPFGSPIQNIPHWSPDFFYLLISLRFSFLYTVFPYLALQAQVVSSQRSILCIKFPFLCVVKRSASPFYRHLAVIVCSV